jgi:hypothetical protein
MTDSFESHMQSNVRPVVDLSVRLGPVDIRLVSNTPDFPTQWYFSATTRTAYAGEMTDFELWCVSPSASNLELDFILPYVDRTYRGNSLAHGYYVTDHFGAPVHLVTRGRKYYVFGEQLERVVWPYFVKHFLMLHSLGAASLHLKAAAFSFGSTGTLLLGRGGAGKTVFLTQVCLHGAQFVSNSHVIMKRGSLYGVISSMRVRPGAGYDGLLDHVQASPGLRRGELIIDPYDTFDIRPIAAPLVKNICVLEHNRIGRHIIKVMSEQEAYDFAEQFALALNVYRLEEDLLDYYQGDYQKYSQAYSSMKTQLGQLIRQCRCFYISSDIIDSSNRRDILGTLAAD